MLCAWPLPPFSESPALQTAVYINSFTDHRAGRVPRSSMTVVPPLVPLSRHSSTVRIRLSASVRTPNPIPPITTPTRGDAGRSSTILLMLMRALEVMQRNFGKAVNPDWNDRCSHPNRRIANHIAMFPRSRPHMPWQNRIKRDWGRPRQADLTPVSVATHKQIKTSMCGLAVDFRRMGQQD